MTNASRLLLNTRKAAGLSQSKMALLLSISPSYLSFMERGIRPITKDVAKKLHQLFHLPFHILFDERAAYSVPEGDYLIEDDSSGLVAEEADQYYSTLSETGRLLVLLEKADEDTRRLCIDVCTSLLEKMAVNRPFVPSASKQSIPKQ